MRFGPGLIIKGTMLGSVILTAFGYFATAGAAPLPDAPASLVAPISAPDGSAPAVAAAPASQPAGDIAAQPQQPKNQAKAQKPVKNKKQNCQVSSSFPESILQWCNLITSYAEQRDLSPDLIAAVMLQESGGNPTAYSSSGAVGLLQVMPRDGLAANFTCGGKPCFSSRPTIQELEDPEYNIEYGTGMLANLLDRFGNLRDALAAYGPKDVGYYYADIVLTIYQRYGGD